MSQNSLGIAGRLAQQFYRSEITPLLALVGLLLGIFAGIITPKEEDPQINVTFANVFIAYPGASAREVESLVASPTEQLISEIKGVKHVYSNSRAGMAVLSVQFKVGENRTDALLRLYNKLYSHQDTLAHQAGVGQPIIKPKGIDDVPVMTLTLTSKNPNKSGYDIAKVAHAIEVELKRIQGTNEIYTVGAPEQVVHVVLDPQKMSAYGLAINDLENALQLSNQSRHIGEVLSNNQTLVVQAGDFLSRANEVSNLVIGFKQGAPVFLRDVAKVSLSADDPKSYVWMQAKSADDKENSHQPQAAVTLAIAKQSGVNANDIVTRVKERIKQLRGTYIPDDIELKVTRDYGKTAEDKADKLIEKLLLVTLVVIALVYFTLGKKEAFVVGTAVIVTLTLTLFASWAFGFTLNRVSLFALIFSIGILVDDAIVVVENIHRHRQQKKMPIQTCIPVAVDEVGGPTILATFTVMAALLPMAFVSGLMGPYMSPIPINASAGMFISLLVAFMLTPWLMYRIFGNEEDVCEPIEEPSLTDKEFNPNRLHRLFEKIFAPFIDPENGRKHRWYLLLVIFILIGISISLIMTRSVVLKMLPFDNKSEFQVVLDMPEGTALETSSMLLQKMANQLLTIPEVTDLEVYAGTSAPINFNGLVRQYYLRKGANVGDIQVNLVEKSERDRKSHEIALAAREMLKPIAGQSGVSVKIVEVPPGPPVLAPIVAEVYGQNYPQQIKMARSIKELFHQVDSVVDVDDSVEFPQQKVRISVDRQKAAHYGVSQAEIIHAINAGLRGADSSYFHAPYAKYPIPIRMEVADAEKSNPDQWLLMKVKNRNGKLIAIKDLVKVHHEHRPVTIQHKDLLPVVYVTGDGAGETDSPLYGMMGIADKISKKFPKMEQALTSQPQNPYLDSIKWDGEWQITFETFRDMGIAYAVGLIVIYLLVVAQFHSYITPLVIMAPIPLTIIGILPGHALVGDQFTATSMIGMIALAGIIVRNSILLVDFIQLQLQRGTALSEAVIASAAVRAKPIFLTALAAILDALFILDDPIFSGLALSLIFGIFISTLLTLVVVPVVYFASVEKKYI